MKIKREGRFRSHDVGSKTLTEENLSQLQAHASLHCKFCSTSFELEIGDTVFLRREELLNDVDITSVAQYVPCPNCGSQIFITSEEVCRCIFIKKASAETAEVVPLEVQAATEAPPLQHAA